MCNWNILLQRIRATNVNVDFLFVLISNPDFSWISQNVTLDLVYSCYVGEMYEMRMPVH